MRPQEKQEERGGWEREGREGKQGKGSRSGITMPVDDGQNLNNAKKF